MKALSLSKRKKHTTQSFNVIFEPLLEGGYNVIIPAVPEICTFGKTLAAAKRMANEALTCYIESLTIDRKRIPHDLRRIPQVDQLNVMFETV